MSEIPTTTPEPIQPVTGQGGALSRLVRVFYQPSQVFREVATAPSWIAVLVAMMLLTVAAQLIITPRIDMEATVREAMEQQGREVSDAQLDQAVSGAEKFAKISVYVTPVAVPVILLLISGIYFLGVRAMGSETEFKPMFSTVLHASWPAALASTVLTSIVALQRASFSGGEVERLIKASVAAWLPHDVSPIVKAVGGVVSVFNVWQWVLLVIGFQIVAKLSRNKAIGVVAVVWGVWVVIKVGLAALQAAF